MGRRGLGVEVRPGSIRLHFVFEGVPRHETLRTNGAPMKPTPANVRYAERLAAEIRERISLGTFSIAEYFPAAGSSGEAMTVARQLEAWLATQRIQPSTKAGYSSAARFWTLAVGDKPLRALKHSDIMTAIAARPSLSGKTVNNYVSVLREALELAVLDGILPANPAGAVPRASHQKDPPDPFDRDEVEAILRHIEGLHPVQILNMVEFRFFTGLRTSEMAGLRWPSVDLAAGSFRVHEAIVRGAEKASTKTGVARDVLLNDRARAALQRQAAHTRLAGGHVFLDPRYGTPWLEERAFRRSYWTPTLKQLGIRYRPPNHMRHTYATMMLMAGVTPAFAAGQMGHSVEMFLRVYSRWIRGGQDATEMAKLAAWAGAARKEAS